ncbi:MAG: hypothetical protein QM790_05115 [Nibricoccus sp.]
MILNRRSVSALLRFFFGPVGMAWLLTQSLLATPGEVRIWTINGVKRQALVFDSQPESRAPRPVIFVFHGHGGNMEQASHSFHLHELWPEAIVVYPQGVPTSGRIVDREGKQNGWQFAAGENRDRDLKFFDAMTEALGRGPDGSRKVFVTGHSNGGAFVLLLWLERSKTITGFAASAAVIAPPYTRLPVANFLLISGEQDELVKFEWQQAMFEAFCRKFRTHASKDQNGLMTAPVGEHARLAFYQHAGTHKLPDEAPALIVKFFQEANR